MVEISQNKGVTRAYAWYSRRAAGRAYITHISRVTTHVSRSHGKIPPRGPPRARSYHGQARTYHACITHVSRTYHAHITRNRGGIAENAKRCRPPNLHAQPRIHHGRITHERACITHEHACITRVARIYHAYTRDCPWSKFLNIPKIASTDDLAATSARACITGNRAYIPGTPVRITRLLFSAFLTRGLCAKPSWTPV